MESFLMQTQLEARRPTERITSTDTTAQTLMQTVSAERAQMRPISQQSKNLESVENLDFGTTEQLYGARETTPESSPKAQLEDVFRTNSMHDNESILANMQAFESRMRNIPNGTQMIESTYQSVLQIVSQDSAVEPASLRFTLAQDMLQHAANPLEIRQGNFNTCTAAVLEGKLWSEHPNKAAQIITENASLSQSQSASGSADANARGLSSDILQSAILNEYLAPQNLRYSIGQPSATNPTGERISPLNEPDINLFPKYLPDPFFSAPLQETYARLSGELVTASNAVFNKGELEDRLSKFYEHQDFPQMAVVNVRSDLVVEAIGADKALGSALSGIEYHAILIENFDPRTAQVTVRNSLDGGKPHSMSVEELSNAMRTPSYTQSQIATLVDRASTSTSPINRADLINFLSRTQETQRQTIIDSIVAAGGRDLSNYLSDEEKERLDLRG
jgi:hypothetical protein